MIRIRFQEVQKHTDPMDPNPARNADFRNSCLFQINSTYVDEMKVPSKSEIKEKKSQENFLNFFFQYNSKYQAPENNFLVES